MMVSGGARRGQGKGVTSLLVDAEAGGDEFFIGEGDDLAGKVVVFPAGQGGKGVNGFLEGLGVLLVLGREE